MLEQVAREKNADFVLISEQHHNKDLRSWFSDETGTCAVWVRNTAHFQVLGSGRGNGYAWVRCAGTTIFSVYLTPNESISEFEEKLQALEDEILITDDRVLVGGNFNAKAIEWGVPRTDPRGRRILEMAARVGIGVLNIGSTTTCRREHCAGTIPDVTFASESLISKIYDWRVLEDYSPSNHQYIALEIRDRAVRRSDSQGFSLVWNIKSLNAEKFANTLSARVPLSGSSPENEGLTAEQAANSTMSIIASACGSSMHRRRPRHGKPAVYWWSKEIAEQRRECHKLRRYAQQIQDRDEASTRMAAYRSS